MLDEIEQLKSKGNNLFSELKFLEAIEFYTSAIELSNKIDEEKKDNRKIAMLFSNRSNCFLNINKNEEALVDAENAINFDNNWFKGYFRKAKALSNLNQLKESKIYFKKSFKYALTDLEKNEIKLQIKNFNIKNNKLIKKKLLNSLKNEIKEEEVFFKDVDENLDEDLIQDQIDFLMSQFIKPYEEDAFRCLGIYHGIEEGSLDRENVQIWIKFAKKFGCGDTPELLDSLERFVELTDEKEIDKEFKYIYNLCGIIV